MPKSPKSSTLPWKVTTFILVGIILGLLYMSKLSTPQVSVEKNKVAGMYAPIINNTASTEWTEYINWQSNFSFLFPGSWRTDLSDDGMTLQSVEIAHGGGAFSGIRLSYHKKDASTDLKKFISELPSSSNGAKLEAFTTNQNELSAYVYRNAPGAGPSSIAYIENSTKDAVIELHCGTVCEDSTVFDTIVSSVSFSTENDAKDGWYNTP